MSRVVVFDLETGGLLMRHPIIQVAAVAVDLATGEIGETFQSLVEFDASVCDPEALKVNGYTPERWANAPHSSVVQYSLSQFLRRHADLDMLSRNNKPYKVARLVAYNAPFDAPRLQQWYKDTDSFLPGHPQVLCAMQLAAWKFLRAEQKPENLKLPSVAKLLGIELDNAHDALADAVAAARVMLALAD